MKPLTSQIPTCAVLLAALCFAVMPAPAQTQKSTLRIRVTEDGKLVPARIRISDVSGDLIFPEGVYKYHQSFVCSGSAVLDVTPDLYRVEAFRGTEYNLNKIEVVLKPGYTHTATIRLHRWFDANGRGWYGGDLHIHRPVAVMPSLMEAEDLNVGVVQSIWNAKNTWLEKSLPDNLLQVMNKRQAYHVLSAEDERDGGAILMFGLKRQVDLSQVTRFFPTSLGFIREAVAQGAWIEQEKPFWWEAPVNVALGGARSTELANNHFCESSQLNNEAWGRPRNLARYPGLMGYADYVFDLYYQFLNAGFPLVATAGSASGVLPNPIGYNRCYVDCRGGDFSYDRWFERLKEGRNFVTNGPMLFVTCNGKGPGEKLPGSTVTAEVRVETAARTRVSRIEVVVDGEVVCSHEPQGPAHKLKWKTKVDLSDASWIAVRCFEPAEDTVRFAHTGPIHIEGRVSPFKQAAAQFFVKWIDELIARLDTPVDRFSKPEEKEAVRLQYLEARSIYASRAD